MSLLKTERETLARHLPGLDDYLATTPLLTLEAPGGAAIQALRERGGPGLLIPRELGGKGATPLEAVRIHRAIGSRSPSLAVAATMHNFSIATLVEFGIFGGDQACMALLGAVAENNLLMASGFAEGRSGTNILAATVEARPTADGGYTIRGSKKPCSLCHSMDLLSGSAMLIDGDKPPRRAVVLVPADSPGIVRKPFWRSSVITGAESDELILEDVVIPGDLLFLPTTEAELDPVETAGYLWFQVLVAASYLGAVTSLVERCVQGERGTPGERALLGIEVEGAMSALEGVAYAMTTDTARDDLLPRALMVRYSVQRSIERAAMAAAELLGGMAFVSSPDIAYLLSATRALAFHPPGRLSSSDALARHLAGERLIAV